ncbi:hypothetical protein FB45DRAFT_931060 [Roridomyces roridus]|uniref:CSC1/OSCA1-like 7TM region domain-containing protein n=1 Tax=Roridomyces roridus TaxID=1738132 RepID=A0AAD7BFA5_9AGAR|nr:hypothetical protein FB45DRAFT_931060 [Roridomyces roridus]
MSSIQENWYTTSNGSVFIPSGTESSSSKSTNSLPLTGSSTASFSTVVPPPTLRPLLSPLLTTVVEPTTTFTSLAESVVITGAISAQTFPPSRIDSQSNPVCIGSGTDSAIGFLIWLIFAILRPRFRQIYALREWFVDQDLRPKPLSSSPLAFLNPDAPMVPSIPSDVSEMGRSPAGDAELFPADELLSQRAIWTALLIVLGWAFLGLAGALPLYMVSLPCLANLPSSATFSGAYSTLEDLSLMRLLRSIESGNSTVSTANLLQMRDELEISGTNDPQHLRVRIIVLTVITLVLALLPALYKIIREINRLIAYRQRWIELRCEGQQMGWLSARLAPGFAGWGEQRFKDFVLKSGLSSGMKNGTSAQQQPREDADQEGDKDAPQIDITNIYSICDTQRLALLIDERDEILEHLEIAEARYVASFRLSTPDPSIADFEPPAPADPSRPHISHPHPLRNTSTKRPRRKRSVNPAFASSSLAPMSFVAPSVYYKLDRVHGVSGGQFGADSALAEEAEAEEKEERPTLAQTISARVVGSRFQEVNRNSATYGRLPLGSHVRIDQSGELGPTGADEYGYFRFPDPKKYGPNHPVDSTTGETEGEGEKDVEWVDVDEDRPGAEDSVDNSPGPSSPRFRRRQQTTTSTMVSSPLKADYDMPTYGSATKRETFPMRRRSSGNAESEAPPHMRLQSRAPFVRPGDGIDFEQLGVVYSDITQWRSRLKAINAEINEAQTEGYENIGEGVRIKGWLMIGRGLRFIDGMQIIEGMAKEDIRWDVLQNERRPLDTVVWWCLLGLASVLLAAGLTAAAGLSLTTAPDVAHYLPFLKPLVSSDTNTIASGLATVLAPAVAATLFICLALGIVNIAATIRGAVSVSGGQLFVFKAMFYILAAVVGIWMVTVGALIYTLQAFNTGSSLDKSQTVADGSIYMSILVLSVVFTAAVIFPGLLLLQPLRLWRVLRAEKRALTPRQRFRAVYPRTYNPAFATGACILAIVFASTFSIIFPLIAPAVVLLLFLTLVAHRFLVGYVYARTHSQTGGLLQIWLMRRFGTLLSFQPILLGLIFLSREFWIEGGVLIGTGFFVILFVEIYVTLRTRLPGRGSLAAITRDSLDSFQAAAKPTKKRTVDDETASLVSSGRLGSGHRPRRSIASVLEMMSVTLAVMPPRRPETITIPLRTETLDDLTATERAARTHPDAPPHLPPLAFSDHAQEMASILYAPELVAPAPIIWLPNDSAGVARAEAVDLAKYHNLKATLDVRSKDDVMALHQQRRTSGSGR